MSQKRTRNSSSLSRSEKRTRLSLTSKRSLSSNSKMYRSYKARLSRAIAQNDVQKGLLMPFVMKMQRNEPFGYNEWREMQQSFDVNSELTEIQKHNKGMSTWRHDMADYDSEELQDLRKINMIKAKIYLAYDKQTPNIDKVLAIGSYLGLDLNTQLNMANLDLSPDYDVICDATLSGDGVFTPNLHDLWRKYTTIPFLENKQFFCSIFGLPLKHCFDYIVFAPGTINWIHFSVSLMIKLVSLLRNSRSKITVKLEKINPPNKYANDQFLESIREPTDDECELYTNLQSSNEDEIRAYQALYSDYVIKWFNHFFVGGNLLFSRNAFHYIRQASNLNSLTLTITNSPKIKLRKSPGAFIYK
jgi:hypothetical protein